MRNDAESRRCQLWLIWSASLIGLSLIYGVLVGMKFAGILESGYSW